MNLSTTIKSLLLGIILLGTPISSFSQGTRLLREPTLSDTHVAFVYGGDVWVTDLSNNRTQRITSTPAVESNPHLSPDGQTIAFSSNRSGDNCVYTVSIKGGEPTRLTWHPSSANVRGWSPDGSKIIYSTSRDSAPTGIGYLWSVSANGGPSTKVTEQWGYDGAYSPDGSKMVVDRVSRWESEFRGYRGGQNTPLIVLNLTDWSETLIPNDKSRDIHPIWIGDNIYFLSDRDGTSNIWSYSPSTSALNQLTTFKGSDIKWLNGKGNNLVFEQDGYLSTFNISAKSSTQLNITVTGDFPWAETKWEDVSKSARNASLSATGKRVIIESRGEIFTVPVENGDARNITQSSGAADRAPIWSPNGGEISWFSDAGGNGYKLMIAAQDGLSQPRSVSIGDSKMAWEPTWSPDGKYIAFVDDQPRIRVLDVASGSIQTADVAGINIERGNMGLSWSPDSQWLAYSKTGDNMFRGIMVWSKTDGSVHKVTNVFADAVSPSWDRDSRHLYFLASTDIALGSGWANTSSMQANPEYAAYVVNLRKDDPSPFKPKSDEESAKEKPTADKSDSKSKDKKKSDDKKEDDGEKKTEPVTIDFENIDRRTMPLSLPVRNYDFTLAGASGSVFIGERIPNSRGYTVHKFELEKREAKEFASNVRQMSVSADGEQVLVQINDSWTVAGSKGANAEGGKPVKVNLQMKLDRSEEWKQIFEEAWRYERDYFYDDNMHGRDWNAVHEKYAPLVPFIKHRDDLTYILDQVNGELSVGHSFVFGGDYPEVEKSVAGLLGADLVADQGRWKIERIFTTESWNPGLTSPLDRPDINVKEGYYLVGINGKELTASQDPYQLLDGTAGVQTVVHINSSPAFQGAWKETVEPITSEYALRQRAWVEDNRRMVDKLSGGKLAYVWVPNTGGPGFVSFNRYYFAQQDKLGAVIDERFNGGGLLDDYMVDLMNRELRAAITNEAPNGKHFRLPAGILGPKVLLINEMAGSGGDYFPWAFRQQKVGPLIGKTTWGGLVKSSVHYALVDGGALTAPDNAVFDPINKKWIGENTGIAPDIEVRQDAASLSTGIDPQLERAVKEVLKMVEQKGEIKVERPEYPTPAKHDE
ncbi:MAG: PDZ domain-containing protein [Fulvivirga sp.]|uniref:S41 family peptidase n=2 Tax=Fulvivirga sp. TaxID=1931237 RepID=UPI0032F04884